MRSLCSPPHVISHLRQINDAFRCFVRKRLRSSDEWGVRGQRRLRINKNGEHASQSSDNTATPASKHVARGIGGAVRSAAGIIRFDAEDVKSSAICVKSELFLLQDDIYAKLKKTVSNKDNASFRLQQKRIENAKLSKLPALKRVPRVEKKKRTSAAHTLRALDRVLLTALPAQKKKVIKKINYEKCPPTETSAMYSEKQERLLPSLQDKNAPSTGHKSR